MITSFEAFKRSSLSEHNEYFLERYEGRLQLRKYHDSKLGAIFVDFTQGSARFRRKYGGGRTQAIAKAIGLKKGNTPVVVDATAGLGRDAFALASLGCRVHMIERSPMIAALLADGLDRARCDSEIGPWVSRRMSLSVEDSRTALSHLPMTPDVIYLDPMYPARQKSALVKKEMQIFQSLLGHDSDADDLLKRALATSVHRVVVKRPTRAPWLAGRKPNTSIRLKRNRFDIYLINH